MSAVDKTNMTGWCEDGRHHVCSGSLRTGTGYHWWCICDCHPEPDIGRIPSGRERDDAEKALAVWRNARITR